MSSHEPLTTNRHSNGRPLPPTSKPSAAQSSWFALPPPLKYLFSRFPLLTLPSSPLPLRTAPHRNQHTLYIFTSHTDAARNAPSFNPTCLKWQTYLKILGVEFRTVGSNNHACPTGALPFLIPAKGDKGTEEERRKGVVESEKLVKWCEEKGLKREETGSARFDAYLALVNWRIRRAWLYALYLSPANQSLMQKLYIHPTTSFTPVQLALSHSLRAAALAELLPSSGGTISPVTLYDEAEDAFKALSELLGEDEWFFGAKEPGFFDASVFSYLYLILEGLEWIDGELRERARRSENLVEFVERVRGRYYKEVGKRVGR